MARKKRNSLATLEDVARRLNVTRVTVSKALRGHPDISAEMAERVRRVARELRYSPNILARNLSSSRSHMIGLVVPKIAHFFIGSLIEAVYDAAFARSYETILTVSQEDAERERKHLETLVSMRVDGIIVSISLKTRDLEIFQWIRSKGIPLVFVDRCPEPRPAGFSTVLVDDRGGALRAITHAVQCGYKKFAFIGGSPHINIGRERLRGFMEALHAAGISVEPDRIIEEGFDSACGYDGLLRLASHGKLPEFVFAATYPVALGIYEAARELGLRIPDQLDIICFGSSDTGRLICPPITSVSQSSRELGLKAVEMLLEDINASGEPKERHVVFPTDLVLRGTCTRLVRSADRSGNASGGPFQQA